MKDVILSESAALLTHALGLKPVMGVEMEFYLLGDGDMPGFAEMLTQRLKAEGISAGTLEKERGEGQYELLLHPSSDVAALARDVARVREAVEEIAGRTLLRPDFRAKPFADRPANGMHVHLSLLDAEGRNVFTKTSDDVYSPPLLHAVGGMQTLLDESMVFFAPTEESYKRYVADMHTPVNNTWGANNRTVAIRLPDTPPRDKRIEHRVPGMDCVPELAMAAVLAAAHFGITHRVQPDAKTYGNATLERRDVKRIARSIKNAIEDFEVSGILRDNYGFKYPYL